MAPFEYSLNYGRNKGKVQEVQDDKPLTTPAGKILFDDSSFEAEGGEMYGAVVVEGENLKITKSQRALALISTDGSAALLKTGAVVKIEISDSKTIKIKRT